MCVFLLIPLKIFLRYRKSNALERTQLKWPLTAIMLSFGIGIMMQLVPGLASLDGELDFPITWLMAMLLPVSVGIAILRHNLFDIDIIINRTLVFAILTALIIISYVTLVSVLGVFIQSRTSVLNGLIATGIIAVLFQPLRETLQKIVNRLLYGQRDEPDMLFSRLATQLETAVNPSNILPNLIQTIAHALKIPYVAIWLGNADDEMDVVAEYGESPEKREMIALVHNSTSIGQLLLFTSTTNTCAE